MSSFLTNLFPSSQGEKSDVSLAAPPPTFHTRTTDQFSERPSTPNRNSFITPISTPQGSPSKKQNPPGANDLPSAFENAMKLSTSALGSPTKLGRQAGAPLSPVKTNTLAADESSFSSSTANADESIIHKSAAVTPGSPLRKQGKENTPPSSRHGLDPATQNQAAISRQEQYQSRDQPQITKKYNTQRGLTAEELEILHKPNVKRLANVTQLCKLDALWERLFADDLQTSSTTTLIC
jgi:cell cycle protein kinase DBF2